MINQLSRSLVRLSNVNVDVNVKVRLYSALSHSVSNALGAPSTAETDASYVGDRS